MERRSIASGDSALCTCERTVCLDLEKFWIGFANKDVSDRYAAQLKEDVEWRKDVSEKTGLGFALSVSSGTSCGQLGQPKIVSREEAKAA